ncbi:MAG TPA: hypothetical protein VHX14_23015 [Thermoanaerobaculia bacterium]|jgi:hypothetical protein|nr:hypothetical protein [Thermoanaerobaculia bacterium]
MNVRAILKRIAPLTIALTMTILSCGKEEPLPATSSSSATPAPAAVKPQVSVPPTAWQVPVDVNPTPPPNPPQANYLDLGWQTFIALSWPALSPTSGGVNGQPDTTATVGATATNGAFVPTVWSTYRDVSTVMLNNGADPGASYTQAVTIPSGCTPIGSNPIAPGFQPMFIDGSSFPNATIVRDYINQATNNPLVDQKGWYTLTDMKINQSEYNYIHQNAYYVGANQAAAYKSAGQLQPFPRTGQETTLPPNPPYAQYGALEVKAAWRVLDPASDKAVIPRYYTQWGYFLQPDGKTCQGPALFGLIGLHILRLTPSTGGTWFWASFEQVDNTTPPAGIPATLAAPGTPNGNCTSAYNVGPPAATGNIPWNNTNKPNNLCEVTPIPSNVQQANTLWQGKLAGTVWQYYEMVNTLNPCPNGASGCATFPPIYDTTNQVNTPIFANTAIESYFQNHTCMDCHGGAGGNGAPSPVTATNQIFTFVLLNAYNPPAATAAVNAHTSFKNLFKNPPFSKVAGAPATKK